MVVLLDFNSLGALTGVDINVPEVGSGDVGRGKAISEDDRLWEWLDRVSLVGSHGVSVDLR